MTQLLAQTVSQVQSLFYEIPCYFCSNDPIVVIFIWAGVLLGIVHVGQLFLHLIDGTRTKATAPISINPADVLKSWVLKIIMLGLIGLFVGLFDYFCFPATTRRGSL